MALTDNLRAYYKLDESTGNPADSSGNGYTLTNTGVTYESGKINNGASGGSANAGNYLGINNNIGVTSAISISCWVKIITAPSSGKINFVAQANNTTDLWYTIYYDGSVVTFLRQRINVANKMVQKAMTLTTGSWYHLVITYDGSNIYGYINGTQYGPTAGTLNGSGTNTEYFSILSNYNLGGFCSAMADEVGVWDRALTSTEVTTLYNGGNGLSYPFSTTNIKSINGLVIADVKSKNGLARASIKSINGLA